VSQPESSGSGPDLLSLLERAAAGRGTVRFLPDEPTPVSFAEMWQRSGAAARWLRGRLGPGGRIAMVLTTSAECLATLVGAWRNGQGVVSLPLPGRGMSTTEYRTLLDRCCAASQAELVLVEDRYRALLPPLGVPVLTYRLCAREGPDPGAAPGAELVQFTSGSTGDPKGVQLRLDAIAANLLAILEVMAPSGGDVACSWLPLSHDMGLVGVCLTSWIASAPRFADKASLCLIRPEAFVADPGIWLRSCSEFGATFTAAPTFAYALASRALPHSGPLDLSRLRVCIVGAESVRPDVLRRFAEAARPFGFDPLAFCPAYGLAEAAVAVTAQAPGKLWSSRDVDAAALADGQLAPARGPGKREIVSCGPPLPGVHVRIATAPPAQDQVGEIEIQSPSLLSGYLPRLSQPITAGGWFTTRDLGFVAGGELYVVGRCDDVMMVRGRKIYEADILAVAAANPAVRTGAVAAVEDTDGGYAVVLETRGENPAYRDLALDIDYRLVRHLGTGPHMVVVVEPGTLPKTSSGKVARQRVQAQLRAGGLATLAEVKLRPGSMRC
jgi:acyl-CoA synthetase (AMP-forming)/AMP-acid ligase II